MRRHELSDEEWAEIEPLLTSFSRLNNGRLSTPCRKVIFI
jgi:transposase